MTSDTSGAGTTYQSIAPQLTHGFQWCTVRIARSLVSCLCSVVIIVYPFVFFFWVIVLSTFDVRLLITPFLHLRYVIIRTVSILLYIAGG
jgi:hypothetical protein